MYPFSRLEQSNSIPFQLQLYDRTIKFSYEFLQINFQLIPRSPRFSSKNLVKLISNDLSFSLPLSFFSFFFFLRVKTLFKQNATARSSSGEERGVKHGTFRAAESSGLSKCNTQPVRANKVHLASRGTASRHSTANYSAFRQTEFQICRDISTAINRASGICFGHSFDPITNGKLSDISSSLINDCIYEISYTYSFHYIHSLYTLV